jgi:hypothetical protein
VSRSRFASITADLLVRKGEAKPWQPISNELPPIVIPQPAAARTMHEPAVRAPIAITPNQDFDEQHDQPRKMCGPARRCAIRLTECEYQRLGIIAVKQDVTRQHILRDAVDAYLASAERDLGRSCACLSAESQQMADGADWPRGPA